MVPLLSLWLPIAVAAVLVFIASSLTHMVLTYHRSDYRKVPREDEVRALLRQVGLTPGSYHFPWAADPKEASTPECRARFEEGPVGMLTVVPNGMPNMGKHLGIWLLYCLVVSLFAGYLAGRTLGPGADYLAVFRVAGTAAFMTYGLGPIVDSIWRGHTWGFTAKNMVDGLIYALVTAGAFGWLWPR